MSNMEHNKGILRPTGTDTEHWTDDDFENAEDNGLVIIHGEVYSVEWEKRGEDLMQGFNNTVVDADGVIYFDTYHYNGGGHWTELVEAKVV